jgi:tetratricopeptide (TPR) repeat protein
VRRVVLLAAALILGAACQQAPVSAPSVSQDLSPLDRLKAEGDALMAKGDYVNAIEKYRQAVDLDASAIGPHFGLGTAYSFLDKRPEAIAQFRWVLARADASSTEYQEAYRWLSRVGALPAAVADASQKDQPTRTVDPSTVGRLVGKTEWPGVTPQRRMVSGAMYLAGDEPVTQDVKRQRAFRLGDAYEFRDLPGGRYRVVAVVDGTTVWDQKVNVETGKDTNLILSQMTSPVPVEKFAPPSEKPDAGAAASATPR